MKLKHLFISALAVVAVAAGCKKEGVPQGDPSITVSPKTLSMSKDADSKVVDLTSNREWKANVDDAAKEWLHVTPEKGDASASAVKVTINCDGNEGDERTGKVVFTTGSVSTTLTVRQEAAKPTVYVSCASIRALAKGDVIAEGSFVKAQVVNNNDLNNLTSKKSLYIQDESDGQAGKPGSGLQVYFKTAQTTPSVKLGDIVKVDLSGLKMGEYGGALQIDASGKEPADVITVLEEGAELLPLEVSIDDLLANKYEDQYVTVKEEVQVVSADLEKKWYSSSDHTSINIETADGKSFVVFTSKYATALDKTVAQGSGNICGVANINNGTVQLFFAKATDADDLTGERFSADVKTVSIDQALTMSGSKVNVIGRVIGVCPKGVIINDGTENNIYVYKSGLDFVDDDIISVTGTLSTYNKVVEFSNPEEVVESSEEVKPVPAQSETEITAANVETWVPSPAGSARVSMQGVLQIVEKKDTKYINIIIDGTTVQGSVIADLDIVKDFDGKPVEVAGFWAGTTDEFFSIVFRSITETKAPYLNISPATLTVNSDVTTASFNIISNTPWTAASETEGFEIDAKEGEGNATITLSFSANEGTDPRTATVKVISQGEGVTAKVFTLTQKAFVPAGSSVELTNAEIVASYNELIAGASFNAGYQAVTVKSESGDWTGFCNVSKTKEKTLQTDYLQFNTKNNQHIKSPVFDKEIAKIEIAINKSATAGLAFYAVPSNLELPASASYTNDQYNAAYAYSEAITAAGSQTTEIIIPSSVSIKDFKLISKGKAGFVDSIKVYFKE